MGGGGMDSNLVPLSKGMAWLLRHGALKAGVQMEKDGSVSLQDILASKRFDNKYTAEDVLNVIKHNDKQRFELIGSAPNLRVRARQGHSQEVGAFVDTGALMAQITEPPPVCVHGTYFECWGPIKATGLKRMTRQHMHFTDLQQQEGQSKVSGFRASAELLIYVDTAKAMADGCVFFRATNGVILSEGFGGVLPTKYFAKVTTRDGKMLDLVQPADGIELDGKMLVSPQPSLEDAGNGDGGEGGGDEQGGGSGMVPAKRGRRRTGMSRVELHRDKPPV